ncbi:MAG TPA: trigger factor [Ktedonobacterales bacterium]|nr:trigger factor [Ktedonobacterales bacterium]
MKVSVERTPESEAVLNVELEWGELEKASERAYHKLAQKYTVPGFRRGHAPRTMLERMLGQEAIYQEGLEDLIDSSYRDALKEHAITPLAQPSLDAPPLEIGQPYSFTARVPVVPEVTLGDYKSVHVTPTPTDVTDDDVQNVIEQVREDHAMWLPAERPAQIGDKVVVDLKLTSGDREISNLHDNEMELAADRAGIFTGMDDQVAGMSEGETKEFDTTIPEDYANTELAGKPAHYVITLKGVKYRELPEVDDELAKSVGSYESLDDLREAVRHNLADQKESESRREVREQTLKQITDASEVFIPQVLVDEETETMLDEMKRMLEQSRISWDQYLSISQKDEAEQRKDMEPEARERVKRDLALDAIADAEGITVSDQELQSWLDMYASIGGRRMRLRDLRPGQRAGITARLRRDKATTFLVEHATADTEATSESAAESATPVATNATNAARATTRAKSEKAAKTATASDASLPQGEETKAQPAAAEDAPVEVEATPAEPEAGIPASAEADV